ncbi:MAG TPA: DUF2029 domain-containing protein [Chloroflexi bacterium]|nr:DUF2029 domain-containing protein [Chloroflexota bacterium]
MNIPVFADDDSADGDIHAPCWRMAVWFFLLSRFLLLVSLPYSALTAYGDHWNFYAQAALRGWPYLHSWTEFPPLFPFLAKALYLLAGGREHTFSYLLALILTLAQAVSVVLFAWLVRRYRSERAAERLTWGFLMLALALPYGWWYFDPLAVLFLLWGLWAVEDSRPWQAGLALGLGGLTKLFPLLALPAVWKTRPRGVAVRVSLAALGLVFLVYGGLYALSPRMTAASLQAQAAKGSWETIWALLDGNLGTGNLSLQADHRDPSTAALPHGNPAKLSPWGLLALFGGLGFLLLWRTHPKGSPSLAALTGFTWGGFLLWSPGYSPQWVLYLLPLILLTLPERTAFLMSAVFLLLSILEWPVMLSRGWFQGLYALVPLRTALLALLTWAFYRRASGDTIEE